MKKKQKICSYLKSKYNKKNFPQIKSNAQKTFWWNFPNNLVITVILNKLCHVKGPQL